MYVPDCKERVPSATIQVLIKLTYEQRRPRHANSQFVRLRWQSLYSAGAAARVRRIVARQWERSWQKDCMTSWVVTGHLGHGSLGGESFLVIRCS